MKMLRIAWVLCLVGLFASLAVAQDRGGRPGRSGRGGRGGFMRLSQEDREKLRNMSTEERRAWFTERRQQQMEQRRKEFMARVKEQLKPANAEEWQILEMQIKQILDTRRSMYTRGHERSEAEQQLRDQSRSAYEELKKLLEQDNPDAGQLQAAMKKYRDVRAQYTAAQTARREEAERKREQAEAQLKQLRGDLKQIVTLRQEAVLLMNGVLD